MKLQDATITNGSKITLTWDVSLAQHDIETPETRPLRLIGVYATYYRCQYDPTGFSLYRAWTTVHPLTATGTLDRRYNTYPLHDDLRDALTITKGVGIDIPGQLGIGIPAA